MRIRPANRRPLLFGAALLATLAATWWAATLDDGVASVASRPGANSPPAAAVSQPRAQGSSRPPSGRPTAVAVAGGVLAVERAPWPAAGATLMGAPASPAPMVLAPPPPPVPEAAALPPLPFRFAGLIEERGQRSVVLLEGSEIRIVRAGERIDSRYRVDRITPKRVEFTYLPLRLRQSLEVSDHDPAQ